MFEQLKLNCKFVFFFSPSAHRSFDPLNEIDEQREFEKAEEFGAAGGDCELQYGTECKKSPLETISHFIHDNHV